MKSNYKKFFSNNTDINFSDYLKNKSGVEILKNLQSKKINTINYYLSYEDFILFSKTFYNYIYLESPCGQVPSNLYDSNTSFIIYEKLLSHMKDCNKCRFSKDILHLYDCHELMGILYPYGEYIETNILGNNLHLHNKINLENFNINNKEIKQNCKSCGSNEFEIMNGKNMYPSQNNFIQEDIINKDEFEQSLRMDAYSIYPHINNDINSYQNSKVNSYTNTIGNSNANANGNANTNTISNTSGNNNSNAYTNTNSNTNAYENANTNTNEPRNDIPNYLPTKEEYNNNKNNFKYHNFSSRNINSNFIYNNTNSNSKNNINDIPIYNTCMKLNKSFSKENIKKNIIPLKKNAKYN
jgi:Zn finger protein HypA/HybF involved in hydrogenase expression